MGPEEKIIMAVQGYKVQEKGEGKKTWRDVHIFGYGTCAPKRVASRMNNSMKKLYGDRFNYKMGKCKRKVTDRGSHGVE